MIVPPTCITTILRFIPSTSCRSCATFGGWNIDGLFKRENNQRVKKLGEDDIANLICGTDVALLIETHCSYKDNFPN